jgi:hypothetical protein
MLGLANLVLPAAKETDKTGVAQNLELLPYLWANISVAGMQFREL